MNTNNRYALRLLDAVVEAGEDPKLAYVVRTRLRRALLAMERGRSSGAADERAPLADAPPMVHALFTRLSAGVLLLCQPSEALSMRWERGWRDVRSGVEELRQWMTRQAS